jgi:hypothetical protein
VKRNRRRQAAKVSRRNFHHATAPPWAPPPFCPHAGRHLFDRPPCYFSSSGATVLAPHVGNLLTDWPLRHPSSSAAAERRLLPQAPPSSLLLQPSTYCFLHQKPYPPTIRRRTNLYLFHHGVPKVLVNPRSKWITSVWSTSTHYYSNPNYD